jgi:hypothetical protein
MKLILFVFLSFISSLSFSNYFNNTADLLDKCTISNTTEVTEQFQQMHCLGYLSGIIDGVQLIFNIKPKSKFFCAPNKGTSPDGLLKIVQQWTKNNPKSLKESARITTLIAYGKKFPCN